MTAVPPFIPNSDDDMHCVNAVFRMVMRHFLGTDMSWEEIDAATRAAPGKGTWTIGGDILLARKGVRVTNIEPVDYQQLSLRGTDYLAEIFGSQTVRYYLERSNIREVTGLIPEFLELVRHETRKSDPGEIGAFAAKGNLVGVTVNSGILNNTDTFALHYVLVYGYDGTHFLVHDPGLPPRPQRKLTVEEFDRSFSYPGGNGGIEVFSR